MAVYRPADQLGDSVNLADLKNRFPARGSRRKPALYLIDSLAMRTKWRRSSCLVREHEASVIGLETIKSY